MAYQNDDLMLINRGGTSFKTEYGLLKQNIIDGVGGAIVSETEPTDDLHEGDFWYKPSTETLSIYVVNETTGIVTALTVRNGGSGYNNSGTDISTNGGSGSGLTIDYQAGVGGALVNPTVNQGGHAYQVSDVVFVTGSGNANGSVTVTAVNTVSVGAWEEVSGGDANHNDGPTAPTTGALGDQWYNTDDGRLYTYTADSSGTLVWIDASPDSIAGGSGGNGGDATGVGADAWGTWLGNTVANGYNIKLMRKEATGVYYVEFNTPMPTINYSVTATNDNRVVGTGTGGKTVNGFYLVTRDPLTTLEVDADTDYPLDFVVHASSTVTPTYTWTRDGTTLKPANDGDSVEAKAFTSVLNAGSNIYTSIGSNFSVSGDTGFQFAAYNSSGTVKAGIKEDGSASFASGACQVISGGHIIVNRTAADKDILIGRLNNANTTQIYADGAATFAGAVNSPVFASDGATATANVYIGKESGTTKYRVQANGQILSAVTTISPISSERRLKENIVAVDAATAWSTVRDTPYYTYNFIGSETTIYGPMADEVPTEMVVQSMEENEAGVMVARSDDEGPIRTFDNGMLQARLYVALQTALTRIEALEAKVTSLEGGTN